MNWKEWKKVYRPDTSGMSLRDLLRWSGRMIVNLTVTASVVVPFVDIVVRALL